ncbi:MAG: GNAT family N-acetyltransferase [Hyphomonadaceae bacterium]
MTIRPAQAADIARLQEIERAAAEMFRPLGLLTLDALSDVVSREEHAANIAAGLAIALEKDGQVAGYATGHREGDIAYLHQIDVHPDFQRRGFGAALLDAFCAAAERTGVRAVFLSTFRHVPWNAPFYRKHGFHDIPRTDYLPWMIAIEADQAKMLDVSTRVFMRRDL